MIEFFDKYPFWSWASISVILFVFEMLTGTMYLLWFGIAAILTAAIAFLFPTSISNEIIIFGVLSVINVFIGRKYIKLPIDNKNDLNNPNSRYIGLNAVAIEDFDQSFGTLQIGDTVWRAQCENGNPKKDDIVQVVRVEGATLHVKSVDKV